MKILSIIIPAYNVSEYIDQCISSLLTDESINECLDIIAINDGSKDDTLEKIKKYEEKYPGIVRGIDKENGGHGSGINKGVELAEGKYLKVLDSDDWVIPQGLTALVDHLKSLTEEPDLIINPFEYVYDGTGEKEKVDYNNLKAGKISGVEDLIVSRYFATIHSATFKTSVYKDNPIPALDTKVSYDDMEYLLYPMPYVNKIMYLPEVIYEYRYGTEGQSVSWQNYIKRRNQHKTIVLSLIKFYQENKNIFNDSQKKYYLSRLYLMINHNINIYLSMEDVKESKRDFVQFIKECGDFDLSGTDNKKLALLMKTDFKGYGLIKKYFNKYKQK